MKDETMTNPLYIPDALTEDDVDVVATLIAKLAAIRSQVAELQRQAEAEPKELTDKELIA